MDFSDIDAIVRDPEACGFRSWEPTEGWPKGSSWSSDLTCADCPIVSRGTGYSFVLGWINRSWSWSLGEPCGADSCESPSADEMMRKGLTPGITER